MREEKVTDAAIIDWLTKKTAEHKVFLEGVGWINLDRDSLTTAIQEDSDRELHG